MIDLQANAFVYILTNFTHTTLYVGITTSLLQRVTDHKNKEGSHFTRKYKSSKLVYVKSYDSIKEAIADEKRIKRWKRVWKDELIEELNPNWDDLYDSISGV